MNAKENAWGEWCRKTPYPVSEEDFNAGYDAGRKAGLEKAYNLTLGESVECSCLDGCDVCDNANAKLRAIRHAIREAANKP